MKIVTVNNKELDGWLGALIGIPIVIVTFFWLAIMFLTIAAILASPIILIVWVVLHAT